MAVKPGDLSGVKSPPLCKNIGDASALLRSLANPSRLAIVCLLLEGERSVMELDVALGIRQPTLSQQLTILRSAGIVAARRRARHVIYRVCDERAAQIVAALRPMYRELLPASALLSVAADGMGRAALARSAALLRVADRGSM